MDCCLSKLNYFKVICNELVRSDANLLKNYKLKFYKLQIADYTKVTQDPLSAFYIQHNFMWISHAFEKNPALSRYNNWIKQ